ncbi:centrosomal protein of 152 kDa isoform X2 [Ambystoma mexicanum]|uniref:centrosomal protein of 152 kDa isoform X2 n=1 Tax=Ambystoma mexicanum TaxID=8296 RepID=UPI0037E9569A
MSLDFDSGALQTQHDDEEEYDKEDYARDQELKQLLTDLPHDMLEDSRDLSSPELNSSDCSASELPNGAHQPWEHETSWSEQQPAAISQTGYVDDRLATPYCEQYMHRNMNDYGHRFGGQPDVEKHTNGWSDNHSEDEDGSEYDINYSYPTRRKEDPEEHGYHVLDDYKSDDQYQQSAIYHLPEDFQPYTNGHPQEFTAPKEVPSFPDAQREIPQCLNLPDLANGHPVESFQVKYNPYQVAAQRKAPFTQENRVDERFADLQNEFLNPSENSSDRIQIAQLQVLYKARGRQLEELNQKLEQSEREMRSLNHQLAMIRAEKEGLAVSLEESQKLFKNGREREIQLQGQIKAMDTTIQTLTVNEEQMRNKLEVSEVAMENMKAQLIDLRRSDSLKRSREQHEALVMSLKQKSEEQLLQLQQKLDAANTALQEKKECISHLEDHVKQLERKQEEGKLEKNEIINRLTRSLEESQRQCANLLQTGAVQETTQLRFKIQQAQSSKIINDNMNRALQEELTELKEQLALYESAAKLGVYLNGTVGEAEVDLSESYVDLGIQNVNWKKSRVHSNVLRMKDPPANLTKDEMIMELKAELGRSLSSNKLKRNQVSQLQLKLKEHQETTEELKNLLEKAERAARDCEVRTECIVKNMDTLCSSGSSESLKDEIQKLKNENQALKQEAEHLRSVQELTQKEENLKSKNQELCNEMRQMIEDFDCDKQEAIERCERTYQQHHENTKNHFQKELSDKFIAEKEQLRQIFEENILQMKAQLDQKDQDLTAVQECYIAVCREKDSLEDTLKRNMTHELTANEEKFKELLMKEKEEAIRALTEKHQTELATTRSQWLKDKEANIKLEVEAQVLKRIEQSVKETENEWQRRLDKTVQEITKAATRYRQDCGIQTEPNKTIDSVSKEVVEELQLKLENALQEKEKAVREAVIELEIRHRDNITNRVESAVSSAHIRWLQELTSLAEYKDAIRAEQERWEKENELIVAKQISAVLTTAEEKWKRELVKQPENSEKPFINVKQKELEEKLTLLTRELESKNEEHAARLKADLAKARAEWNKEKQEEINRIRGQNEEDYRTFLDGHRNKINEVLAQAKEDFERQKRELLIQKKTEMKECLEQNRKEWAVKETKKMQQHESEILSSIEFFLDKIHQELVKGSRDKSTVQEPPSFTSKLTSQYQDQLMGCLRKAYQEIVCRSLENAMQSWRKKSAVCIQDRRTGASEDHQKLHTDVERQITPMRNSQDIESEPRSTKTNLGSQCNRCERCLEELEKSKSECRELKSKLEKACRHLQLAVKEQRARGEQAKENESVIEILKKENGEVQRKLQEMNSCIKTTCCLQLEETDRNSCPSCCGKGLEEMRSQYIIAVDKIREDMLRYIQESRERAAEMLKAEVLRERQETARKMRKYYLVCLQQLLKDDGKHEGAEKKIMNAASKLATMAKVLETPITHKSHSKYAHAARSQHGELPAGFVRGRSCNNVLSALNNGDSLSKDQTGYKLDSDGTKCIPCVLKHKVKDVMTQEATLVPYEDANVQIRKDRPLKEVVPVLVDENGKELLPSGVKSSPQCLVNSANATQFQNPKSSIPKVKLKSMHDFNWIDGLSDSESDHVPFKIHTKQTALKGCLPNHLRAYARAPSERSPRFDIQETPVRDESGPNDWSLLSENLKLDGNSLAQLHAVQKESSVKSANAQAQSCNPVGQYSAAGLLSSHDESLDVLGRETLGENNPEHAAKRKAAHCSKDHFSKMAEHRLHQSSNIPGTVFTQRTNSNQRFEIGKASKAYSRKLLFDVGSVQQDSGFDSPQLTFT